MRRDIAEAAGRAALGWIGSPRSLLLRIFLQPRPLFGEIDHVAKRNGGGGLAQHELRRALRNGVAGVRGGQPCQSGDLVAVPIVPSPDGDPRLTVQWTSLNISINGECVYQSSPVL